ncbi:DUF177 domain-containing protein [Hazenella sp. IB182357]|uniref:DUF177 domain-containing protein n=1 Tax=Polycladospora coralii TaxID=2771432 RepID=A0A926N534_9BACL|nr:DUF177 domain-containing protein [Polycladospora coralii]MBD1371404.1 DUF177 domain-containing protein [Polycladospora coralii]MBS7530372.1 DUF177 domain-containing protein [Polycladospora coralii]
MQIFLQTLNQLQDKPFHVHELVSFVSLETDISELVRMGPVDVHASFYKLESNLFQVDVTQSTNVVMTCSRCLMETETTISTNWSMQFTDVSNKAKETEEHVVIFIDGNAIDLLPYIREELLLHIPYAPICKEDCAGLCLKCGINKNVEKCKCRTERIDPRLEKLQELFNEGSN